MCGIAGFINRTPLPREVLASRMQVMSAALRHRGPDGHGVWISPEGLVAMAHTRLSIIDLSPLGAQPMCSADGRYSVVFNGEIYNFQELRKELLAAGAQMRSGSDTEVLIESIAHFGLRQSLKRFRGMFAFALYDNHLRKLHLVRDRLGKKPLFVMKDGDGIAFASELKALLRGKPLPAISQAALSHYLSFGYVPHPLSIFEGIVCMDPATIYTVEASSSISEIYWSMPDKERGDITLADAVDRTEEELREAVRLRLIADVPVGCFLSGGIDSGLLVAMAARASSRPLRTFTVRYRHQEFDEGAAAVEVARRYGAEHSSITIDPENLESLHQALNAFDQPFADPSAIPAFLVAAEARKHVKVVLNGEGADELFCGYRRYQAFLLMQRLGWAGRALRPFATIGQMLLPVPRCYRSKYAFVHRMLRGIAHSPEQRYLDWNMDGFSDNEKKVLCCGSAGENSLRFLMPRGSIAVNEELSQALALDSKYSLHDDMLVKMDIATMAHGLEARCPFLDHKLVEAISEVPLRVRCAATINKPILRQLASRHLPASVATAPKRGFEIPLYAWLSSSLCQMVKATLLDSQGIIAQLFNRRSVEQLLGERRYDPDRWSRRVWILFVLELWHQRMVAGCK